MLKSLHYWKIHRKVTQKVWRNLDRRTRDIIAADVAHETPEYKAFENHINSETEKLYMDPTFPYNEPHTFKVSRYE